MNFKSKFDRKKIPIGYLVTGLLCAFVILQFFLQGSLGVMAQEVKKDFNIDAASISFLSSSFFYSYILLQIPVGLLLDKFGIKSTCLFALIIMGLSCFLFSYTSSFKVALVSRFIMGSGASFGFLAMLRSIKMYFPSEKFIFIMSLLEFFGMLGIALCNTLFSYVTDFSSWRVSIVICGILCFVLAIAWYNLNRSGIEIKHEESFSSKPEDNFSFLKVLKKVFSNRLIWFNGIYAAFLYSIITVFVALWGIPYTEKVYDLSTTEAAFLVSFVYIGLGSASIFLSWFVSVLNMKIVVRLGSVLSLFLLAAYIYFPPNSILIAYFLLFLTGASCSVYQLSFGIVTHNVSKETQSTAGGVTNMLCMSGAPILQPAIGLVLTLTQGTFFDGYESYTVNQYKGAFILLVLCLVLAVFFSWFIFPNSQDKESS